MSNGGCAVISIFVIDDHPLVSGGVKMLLAGETDFRVVGRTASVREALLVLPGLRPNVVLLDLRMPGGLGSESVPALRRASPTTRVVMFTAYSEHPAIASALVAGASGALLKDAGSGDLAGSIRRVVAGEVVVDHRLVSEAGGAHRRAALARTGLTDREYDVLCQVAMGHTNPEIADALGLSRNTVKSYLQSCMNKLAARNRVEAISRAAELGLV